MTEPTKKKKATLNPNLKEFWQTKADIKILKGGRASSKCLAYGTKVLMADFTTRSVQFIQMGMDVMGPDGNPRRVMANGRGRSKMYTVKQEWGTDYTVNSDHILALRKIISPEDESDPLIMGHPAISETGDFVNIEIERFLELPEYIQKRFYGYKAEPIELPRSEGLRITPYTVGSWAENHERIPDAYLHSSFIQRASFLAGMIDSYGFVDREEYKAYISLTKPFIIRGFVKLCGSLGFILKELASDDEGTKFCIMGPLYKIPFLILEHRKIILDKRVIPGDFYTSAIEIVPAPEGDYAGISVVGELYLLEDFTVVHNTWDTAGFSIFLARNYKVKFLCMRQLQNRIQDSVYSTLVAQIDRFGLAKEFEILKSTIIHRRTKSQFHFHGIKHDVEEIKGFEGADIGWIEEGEGLTKDQWALIEPTIRKEGSECWIVYNPRLTSDFIETFKHDPANGVIVRHINYDENPFLSKTMLRKIERLKELDYDEYAHIYLGQAKSDDENVIIKPSWIEAAIDACKVLGITPSGESVVGFDVADSGGDLNAMVARKGIHHHTLEKWKGQEDELLASSTKVYNLALKLGARINYDSIGIGASAGSKFSELNQIRKTMGEDIEVKYNKFMAHGKVLDPGLFYINTPHEKIKNVDFFDDVNAQAWWNVAERFMNTYNAVRKGVKFEEGELISIAGDISDLNMLYTELSTPRKAFSPSTGKVKRESKDKMKSRGIKSPNLAEAFIICNAPQKKNYLKDLLNRAIRQ